MLDYLALMLTKIYNVTVVIPRWLLVIITGSIGSLLVNVLHSSKGLFKSSKRTPDPNATSTSTDGTPKDESTAVQSPSKSGPNKRKAGKK